ncbi:hypothetical protein [Kitasatospora sp. NPDC002965]|uniref:hypothetical protein n=1 Tax=Kitasatospora sp. NPDC002965 TaxID=3154775 RepID=UPI0033AB9A7A
MEITLVPALLDEAHQLALLPLPVLAQEPCRDDGGHFPSAAATDRRAFPNSALIASVREWRSGSTVRVRGRAGSRRRR